MKVAIVSGSVVGSKTRKITTEIKEKIDEKYSDYEISYIDLKDYDMPYSDGRNYLDYDDSTSSALKQIMEADVVFIGTPIFQASIPAPLKNLFDLLPPDGFRNKTVGMVITAGSQRHYLVAEQQLKPILAYMKANIVQGYVYAIDSDFGSTGVESDDIYYRIDRLIEATFNEREAQRHVLSKYEEHSTGIV